MALDSTNHLIIRVKLETNPTIPNLDYVMQSPDVYSQWNIPRILSVAVISFSVIIVSLMMNFSHSETPIIQENIQQQISLRQATVKTPLVQQEPKTTDVTREPNTILAQAPETLKLLTEPSEKSTEEVENKSVEPSSDHPLNQTSPFVKRALFTSDISSREPVDDVGERISQEDNTLDKVIFFTEIRDLKGKTVFHQWKHEGRLVTEIPYAIGGNRWRIYSSKTLNKSAIGNWDVVVSTEEGEILTNRKFVFK